MIILMNFNVISMICYIIVYIFKIKNMYIMNIGNE